MSSDATPARLRAETDALVDPGSAASSVTLANAEAVVWRRSGD